MSILENIVYKSAIGAGITSLIVGYNIHDEYTLKLGVVGIIGGLVGYIINTSSEDNKE